MPRPLHIALLAASPIWRHWRFPASAFAGIREDNYLSCIAEDEPRLTIDPDQDLPGTSRAKENVRQWIEIQPGDFPGREIFRQQITGAKTEGLRVSSSPATVGDLPRRRAAPRPSRP